MCEYCQESKWIFEFEDGQIFKNMMPNERPSLEIMHHKEDGSYHLNMCDEKDSHYMWDKVINYCPMCGEKL